MVDIFSASTLLIAAFIVCIFFADAAFSRSVREVNSKLPDDQRITQRQIFWSVGKKMLTVWVLHKELCPGSRWRTYWVVSHLAALLFVVFWLYLQINSIPQRH
jgi:hypothetical protein